MNAWWLLLATVVPFRLLTAVGSSGLIRQRLLAGALQPDANLIRREGADQLLGCTMEADAIGSLAFGGGMHRLCPRRSLYRMRPRARQWGCRV